MKFFLFALATLVAGAFSCPVFAADIGVVFMDGKWAPKTSGTPIGELVRQIERAGFPTDYPEMPWSRDRAYDRDVPGALAEIDAAVERLKKKGAKRIVVGGQSLGANIAIAYAARRDGLAGVLAVSPGHVPELRLTRNALAEDVGRARKMVADGNGAERATFLDINQGERRTMRLPAQIYLSWMDPAGDAVMSANAAKIPADTALLWVVGEKDGIAAQGSAYAFDKASPNPKSRYLPVSGGDHRGTARLATGSIIEWLKGL